jgi:hypothetical protein
MTSCITVEAVGTIAPYTPFPTSTPTYTPTSTPTHTPTPRFAESIAIEDVVTAIYIPGLLLLPIGQQPYPAFVTEEEDEFTEFGLAADYGSIGLLAHNYLAGKYLPEIETGEIIYLTYTSNVTHKYIAIEFWRFQALDPYSVYSDFILTVTGDHLTVEELFDFIYNRPGSLILQTSIAPGAWGRLFIIAERIIGE